MSNSPLTAIVFASIKFARLRARYQAATRFGLASNARHVIDEYPDDLVAVADPPTEEADSPCSSRRSEIVEAYICEFTSNLVNRELIRRALFNGESVSSLANELGINQATARSAMHRAKKFLGIDSL